MSKWSIDSFKIILINLIGCILSLLFKQVLLNSFDFYNSILLDNIVLNCIYVNYLFLFSLVNNNNNFVDAAWGYSGLLILVDSFLTDKKRTAFYYSKNFSFNDKLLLIGSLSVLIIYSLRHILIYITAFPGFKKFEENFRYVDIRNKFEGINKTYFWIFSYLCLHVMIIVYLTCAYQPIFDLVQTFTRDTINYKIIFLGLTMAYGSILLETVADEQLNMFRYNRASVFKASSKYNNKVIFFGLWKYLRHPNYFGEVLYFLSLIIINYGFTAELKLINGVGFLLILSIFAAYSVPKMEEHLVDSYKEDYMRYQNDVNYKLIPFIY